MPTITINNPTVAVTPPTPIANNPLAIEGNGDVKVQLPAFKNDGNAPAKLSWSVTNILNGNFVSTAVETDSVNYKTAIGQQTVPAGGTIKLAFFFKVTAGAPGVVNPPCTADYDVQWI